jgi:predicted dehydrogenase
MAPIRVGLIGLSSIVPDPAAYTPGTWGLVHLSSLQASPHYEIVALCNSSLDAARRSIEHNKLDSAKVKPYGSPEDLAADPDVDLVAVSVSVFKHYQLMKPALLAGKNVMVEYPVTPTLEETEELARIARETGAKTVVGAQARGDVVLRKLKELVESKVVGDVVSSIWIGHAPVSTAQGWPANLTVFLDNESAQSLVSIVLGHGKLSF